jgi:hypothetical protein
MFWGMVGRSRRDRRRIVGSLNFHFKLYKAPEKYVDSIATLWFCKSYAIEKPQQTD